MQRLNFVYPSKINIIALAIRNNEKREGGRERRNNIVSDQGRRPPTKGLPSHRSLEDMNMENKAKEGTPTYSEHFPQPTIGLHHSISFLLSTEPQLDFCLAFREDRGWATKHEDVEGYHMTSHTGSSKDRKERETDIPEQGALHTKPKAFTLLVGYTESSTIAATEFFVQTPCPSCSSSR